MALTDGGIALNGLQVEDFTSIWLSGFDLGAESVETSDIDNSLYDTTRPGRDLYRGPTWAFEVTVVGDTAAEVFDNEGLVRAAWRNQEDAKYAGSLSELEVNLAGRQRLVYGRPRRFASTASRTAHERYAIIDCDFKLMDPLIYDEAWKSLTFPLPASDTEVSVTDEIAEVGGSAPTPFMVDVFANDGDILNPQFTIDGNRYEFDMTIPAGEWLRVDTRRGFALLGTQNVIGRLKQRTRIRKVNLPAKGPVDVLIGGADATGTAEFKVWWRPAHYSI